MRFFKHMRSAVIVMFASSALLFEGFLCVLMFLPIYTFIAAITFALSPKQTEKGRVSDTFKSSLLPLVVLLMSLEGTSSQLSFERHTTIERTKIVDLGIPELKENLAKPIHLNERRSAFLSLFPLPTRVDAGTLNKGDIHKAYFTYKRWGFTNIHKGETWVKISDIGDFHVETEIVKDTSYFSKYLSVHGTRIDFEPVSSGKTAVTLTIQYERLLDPAWYFDPMQKAAMDESAGYLIDHVISRTKMEK